MALRYLIYPLVLLLAPATCFASGTGSDPVCGVVEHRIDTTQDCQAFIINPDLNDLINPLVLYLEEENASGRNEDSRDDNRQGGKVTGDNDGWQPCRPFPVANLWRSRLAAIPNLPAKDNSKPRFLLFRVFRI